MGKSSKINWTLIGVFVFSLLLSFSGTSYAETDVTNKVQLVKSRLMYDRLTKTNYLDVSLKNISQDVLLTPIKVVIDSISNPTVTVAWDWDRDDRLWWADRPSTTQWSPSALPAPAVNAWYSIDITDLYNAWQDGTYANYGLQLRPTATNNRWNFFYSSDYIDDPTLRPKLVVTP